MSIDLAAAGLSCYLPEPVPAADDADCLTALHGAQRELLTLDDVDGPSRVDVTRLLTRVALALAEAQSLTC